MSAKDHDAIIEMNLAHRRITDEDAYAYTSDPGDQPKRVVFTDGTIKAGYVQGRAYMAELLAKAVMNHIPNFPDEIAARAYVERLFGKS